MPTQTGGSPMIRFSKALTARNSAAFNATIKDEIEHLDVDLQPL